jgi:multicomponent Na+:H+ antiporter subunit G
MIVLQVISVLMLALGSLFSLIGAVGLNRLPDFYTRSHAVGVADTMGAGLIMVGLMVHTVTLIEEVSLHGEVLVLIKLIAVLTFLLMTSPISGHAVTRAAWRSGLMPVTTDDEGGSDA